jgi:hypothetical protein
MHAVLGSIPINKKKKKKERKKEKKTSLNGVALATQS